MHAILDLSRAGQLETACTALHAETLRMLVVWCGAGRATAQPESACRCPYRRQQHRMHSQLKLVPDECTVLTWINCSTLRVMSLRSVEMNARTKDVVLPASAEDRHMSLCAAILRGSKRRGGRGGKPPARAPLLNPVWLQYEYGGSHGWPH